MLISRLILMFLESGSRGAKEKRVEERVTKIGVGERDEGEGGKERDRARKFNVGVSQYGQVITQHRST